MKVHDPECARGECTPHQQKPVRCDIEFAGHALYSGMCFQRCGSDSHRDFTTHIDAIKPWDEIDLFVDAADQPVGPLDLGTARQPRTLAKLILTHVFGRETARVWHSTFNNQVIARYGTSDWRLTAAEIAHWHLHAVQKPVLVS